MFEKVKLGDVVGHLTVVEINDKNTVVVCRCVCGKSRRFPISEMNDHRSSCGCRGQKYSRDHKLYRVWSRMKVNHEHKVCIRWRGSYDLFAEDVIDQYVEGHVFQRVDRTKPYDKDNFEFAEKRGRSNPAKFITYRGESRSIKEWSKIKGICASVIYRRISDGWCNEKVLSTPPRTREF